MDEMLNLVDSPALFWLDGHVDGVNADCLWDELEHIKNGSHTVNIDVCLDNELEELSDHGETV